MTTPIEVAEFHSAPTRTLRLYAGQVDANDASHFTIEFRSSDSGGIIDCWLQSDDTVKYSVRPKQ